ncbi:hypothetical protein GCM10009830_40580 [Glycomyces endophyticus]|uniref:Uncharacterized protein n=1 Tax=Glycomyces endophyticus TaxID=480996 RepID=A0ABN2HJV0_9ACTN
MRLEGREWRVVVDEVRLGVERFRVVRAVRVGHLVLHEGRLGAQLSVDRQGTVDLAIAWWLASRSPRSLVYLPLRESAAECGAEYGGRKLDLVLLHHSLGFRPSQWKAVRGRLGAGRAQKVTAPAGALPEYEANVHQVRWRREFRDRLRWTIAADTLFLVGSRTAFELEGGQVRALAEDCPAHLAEQPGTHCCAEIEMGRRGAVDRRNPYAQLHVECCNRHW